MRKFVLPSLLLAALLALSLGGTALVKDYNEQINRANIVQMETQSTVANLMQQQNMFIASQILTQCMSDAPDYAALQAISVRVEIEQGSGSGVLVTRMVDGVVKTYVWTAGHVAEPMMNEDGSFRDLTIYSETRVNGKPVKRERVKAKVIAYSAPDVEDLALLEVLKDDYCPINVSATFADDTVQAVGTEIVHVGCTLGLYDSASLGIVSQTDVNMMGDGVVFDQTSCMGYPGSSGGGVYLKDGRCIGLLTRGAGAGLNFIVPMRRISAWAKKMKIEWAFNDSKMPLVRAPTSLEKQAKKATTKKRDARGAAIRIPKPITVQPYAS